METDEGRGGGIVDCGVWETAEPHNHHIAHLYFGDMHVNNLHLRLTM